MDLVVIITHHSSQLLIQGTLQQYSGPHSTLQDPEDPTWLLPLESQVVVAISLRWPIQWRYFLVAEEQEGHASTNKHPIFLWRVLSQWREHNHSPQLWPGSWRRWRLYTSPATQLWFRLAGINNLQTILGFFGHWCNKVDWLDHLAKLSDVRVSLGAQMLVRF